jgi:hypothetical protein
MNAETRKLIKVPLASIQLDRDTQSRARMYEHRIVEYAEAIQRGADLFQSVHDPVTLFHDGTRYLIGDGWHRITAALRAGKTQIFALVKSGGKDDAIVHAIGANTRHGIQRTIEDKHRAVRLALQHPKLRRWSDRAIAKHADVSHPFVAKVRATLSGNVTTPTGKRGFVRREKPIPIPRDPLDAKAAAIISALNSLFDENVMLDLQDLHGAPLSDERREELGEVAARLIDELTPFAIRKDEDISDDDPASESVEDL